ncbi:unnamed protein product [Eruca vesicaria subsp. sativa]|uniref:Uncharacterized protein n=1 Tax=Eruca vesicaria subsp. sativa TaxID=29727 RepID=A0ABC8M878_ERUVS|nr:unnamed protein product [Eruca vesicaria subsp. sativa]
MGLCCSSESTQEATAKLILQDGRMIEFTSHVKVGYVLQKYPIYQLVLPLRWLREPLGADEMAALAVKASAALAGGKRIDPIVSGKSRMRFGSSDDTVGSGCVRRKERDGDGGGGGSGSGSTSSGRRRRYNALELRSIEE